MSASASILSSLEAAFAPLDAEVLQSTLVWAQGRKVALQEVVASEEAKKMDTWTRYAKRFAICGGKSWHEVISTTGDHGLAEFVTKNCAANVAKRNANIARKLAAAGVQEVLNTEYTRTQDGFDGTFILNTDSGRKVLTGNTIRAGGFNIQCLHLRVLTKIRA